MRFCIEASASEKSSKCASIRMKWDISFKLLCGPQRCGHHGCLRVNAFGDRRTPLAINSMKGLARSHRVFKHLCALSVWQRECTRPCVQSSENYFAKLPEHLQGRGKVIMSLPLEGIQVIDYTE